MFSLSMEISRLTRDGTAEPVSRDQTLSRERGQGNIHFPWCRIGNKANLTRLIDPYSCSMCDHTYTYIHQTTYYTRDGTAETAVSRGQIPRRERGQGNIHFLRSADHEKD